MTKTTVDKLQEAKKERDTLEALGVQKLEDYKKALNNLAGSEHGSLVLRSLMNAMEVFKPIDTEGIQLVRQTERRNIYLKHIRPYLTKEMRSKLENER